MDSLRESIVVYNGGDLKGGRMFFEYKLVITTVKGILVTVDGRESRGGNMNDLLKTLGAEKWEVVGMVGFTDNEHNQRIQYLFKRSV